MSSDHDPTIDTLDLPEWMLPTPALKKERTRLRREVTHTLYEQMFEHVMDGLSSGISLKAILKDDFRDIDYRSFYCWMIRDEKRKQAYYEAQELAAEILSAECIEIADASDSLEDVARSTLRINTRWKTVGIYNRERFGDVKRSETNVNIDLSGLMKESNERLANRTIDSPARVIQFPTHSLPNPDEDD